MPKADSPLQKNAARSYPQEHRFFFAYYEGQRDRQGETQAAIVPTAAQRRSDFSGLVNPSTGQRTPLIDEFAGTQFPNHQIAQALLNPISLKAESLFPLPNIGPELFLAECFNCLNHANFGSPENYIQSPAFGRFCGRNPPRLLQVAVKFRF